VILAAGLLVLLGLGLFVGGIVTSTTALYWGCVAACGLAAVLLVVTRLRMAREARDFARRASRLPSGPGTTAGGLTGTGPPGGRHAEPLTAVDPEPADAAPGPAGATAVRTPQSMPGPEGATALRMPEPEPSREQPPAVPASSTAAADEHTPPRRGAHEPREVAVDAATQEPGEEDVEVTDLLLVVDLDDEVLVVDEHPRYHLPGCPFLEGRDGIGLPMVEARTDGFTPCAACRPVRHLAETERSRRRAVRGN
jgi:hypothetical protein